MFASPASHRLRLSRVGRATLVAGVLALGAGAIGCKGDGGGPVGPTPTIAGRWSGSAKAGLVDFSATFTQRGDSVGGTGRFSSPLGGDDFTVQGVLRGTDVDLILTSDELGATTFRGRFIAADRIEGTVDRPGEDDLDLTLDRE